MKTGCHFKKGEKAMKNFKIEKCDTDYYVIMKESGEPIGVYEAGTIYTLTYKFTREQIKNIFMEGVKNA